MFVYSKKIYFPNQIIKSGYLEIKDGKFGEVHSEIGSEEYLDYSDYMLVPGFIDQHIHGYGTGSFIADMSEDSIMKMKEVLPFTGVTSFLATSGADDLSRIKKGIVSTRNVYRRQKDDGATLLGVHLEGPFINAEFKGMQREEYCLSPSIELMKEFLDLTDGEDIIRLMTIAPELPNSLEVIKYCKLKGIQLSIGHSAATFDVIKELKEYGLGGVIHMFSGMKGFHHRELGVAGSALYFDDLYCEFAKQTGMTVKPEAFDLAYRLKGADKIILSTDAAGMAQINRERYHYIRKETFIPDGDYLIIRGDDGSERRVYKYDYESVKDLEMGFLESVQNVIENVNPSVHEVIKMSSENPAKYINVYDRKGSLDSGKDADFLVVDKDFNLITTFCNGKEYAL